MELQKKLMMMLKTLRASDQDLSLGFHGGTSAGAWSSSAGAHHRQINYGLPGEMGMFVVAPATHHLSDHAHVAGAGVGVGVGVIPLVTAGEEMLNNRDGRASNTTSNNNSIQFWQHPQHLQHLQHPQHGCLKKPIISDHRFLQGGGAPASTSASTMTCQDCGNQAKKDCTHRRCRTCCKSRGFDCATHVKSTWVPAARRRERQLMTSTGAGAGSSASTSGTKKPRLNSQTTTTSHTSTSNTSPSSSHHQDASFIQSLPGQVRAPAVFKCVKVTSLDEGDDEYAYHASVKIGGHVFKGFLYDQGVERRNHTNFPNLSELHLGGSLTSPVLDPPEAYGSSGGVLLGGSTYVNPTS